MAHPTSEQSSDATQKRVVTFVSGHPPNSKWWCKRAHPQDPSPCGRLEIGDLPDNRERFGDEDATDQRRAAASRRSGSRQPASSAPSASEPVSPMKISRRMPVKKQEAGAHAPMPQPHRLLRRGSTSRAAIDASTSSGGIIVPAARPSRPSVRLTPCVVPVIARTPSASQSQCGATSANLPAWKSTSGGKRLGEARGLAQEDHCGKRSSEELRACAQAARSRRREP